MIRLDDNQRQRLREAVAHARSIDALAPRVESIYRELEVETAKRQPRCDQSGRCCRFESYGHLLFVTTIELACFAQQALAPAGPWDGLGCPHQQGGLCSVHSARPLGCRIYFCDPTSSQWQSDGYEHFQSRLRALHDEWSVDYLYVEWREGLRAIDHVPVAIERAPLADVRAVALPVLSPGEKRP